MSLPIYKHLSDLHVPDFKIIHSPNNSLCCVGKAGETALGSFWSSLDSEKGRSLGSTLVSRLHFESSEFCMSISAAKPARFNLGCEASQVRPDAWESVYLHNWANVVCTPLSFPLKKKKGSKTSDKSYSLLTKIECMTGPWSIGLAMYCRAHQPNKQNIPNHWIYLHIPSSPQAWAIINLSISMTLFILVKYTLDK